MALDEYGELKHRGLDRIMGLSDGIFAFAITLMVLDLVVPVRGLGQDPSALPGLLATEWVGFLNYFLSFFIVAIWWNAHHRIFEHVTGYDGRLKALNLLVLLTVTLVPFLTKLYDNWQLSVLAPALYSLDQAAAGAFLTLLWLHVTKGRKFVAKGIDERLVKRVLLGTMSASLMFAASVPFAFVEPRLPQVVWLATAPVAYLVRRTHGGKGAKAREL